MTIKEKTICSLIQSFPVLLILAQKHSKCLETPFVYKPPTPTPSPEYYEALDALFQSIYGHGSHGSHGEGQQFEPCYNGQSKKWGSSEPCYQYVYPTHNTHTYAYGSSPSYGGHSYGTHNHGTPSYGTFYSPTMKNTGYSSYGMQYGGYPNFKTGNIYDANRNVSYGYAYNQGYAVNNRYKIVVKKTRIGSKKRSGKSGKLRVVEPCKTQNGGGGMCVSMSRCNSLDSLGDKSQEDFDAARLLHTSTCTSQGSSPKVCCLRTAIKSNLRSIRNSTTMKSSNTNTSEFVKLPKPPVCGISKVSIMKIDDAGNATLGQFPWIALLGYKTELGTEWRCTGSLISSRHILTAAHCMHNLEDQLYQVQLGGLDISRNDSGIAAIKDMVHHEEFNPETFVNDIGILVLDEEAQFTEMIRPICIPTANDLSTLSFVDHNFAIAAWLRTNYTGLSETQLQFMAVSIESNESCADAYQQEKLNIDDSVFCVRQDGSTNPCLENGGPLMVVLNDLGSTNGYAYQIGISSYGVCAGSNNAAVYTRVAHFIPWILEKLNQ